MPQHPRSFWGGKCLCSPRAGVSGGHVAVPTRCSDSQGPGATRPLPAKYSPCPHPGALMAETLGLLTHTKAAARHGAGPAMDLRPLRPGDSLTKLQGTVPELMLLGPTRGLFWAPAGTGEESARASPRGVIVFPVAGALPDCASVCSPRQVPSCRRPPLRLCHPPTEGDPKSCLHHHNL